MSDGETVDAFHRGRFVVVQPEKRGHRSGVDAMILAGAVATDFAGTVADFGAGAGAAGMAVASRCASATITFVENDARMAGFARKTIGNDANAELAARLTVIEADIALSGKMRVDSGLSDRMFDQVIMNPPFNSATDRATPDALKASAHVMSDDLFETWLRTAAAVLKPNGGLAIIARPASLNDMLNACKGRFGGVRIVPILPRPEGAAIRVVLTGILGSRAGVSLEAPLVLHGDSGNTFSPRANAIINGERGLFD